MAILYGTQSNGETLPVLVDQFGNLIAKGIDGAPGEPGDPGPPGPPGIGELPPDPLEGALLGWKDGELAWIGGSVPLPAGTYGPYVYKFDDQILEFPQDATGLVYGQQLYMSDETGKNVTHEYKTDTIANVDIALPESFTTNASENAANALDGNWETSAKGSRITITFSNTVLKPGYKLYGSLSGRSDDVIAYNLTTSAGSFSWSTSTPGTGYKVYTNDTGADVTVTSAQTYRGSGGPTYTNAVAIVPPGVVLPDVITTGAECNQKLGPYTIFVKGQTNTLTFPTNNNFDKFEVGDAVQETDVIIIDIAADAVPPTISTDGGAWMGTDGSGTGVQTELTTTRSGSGSVSLGFNGGLVLRDNNAEWVDGYYVTAPEQRIALRNVAISSGKKRQIETQRD